MSNLKIELIGSTKPGFVLPKNEALKDGGMSAAICYMRETYEEIQKEKGEETDARIKRTLRGGHHSVYDHTNYNLLVSGLPKILAMVLNNERMYATSEKSARYTQMEPGQTEKELYNKWMKVFCEEIEKIYPQIPQQKREKLAQENARYLTSVFTPTSIKYTTSFRQLNYIMHRFEHFIKIEPNTTFNEKLKKEMDSFNEQLKEFYVEELAPNLRLRELSLFAKRAEFNKSFDEVYSTNYKNSLAYLAQAHRHRTLNYQMQPIKDTPTEFFVPPILLGDNKQIDEWSSDMERVADLFPQGSIIQINERGTYENFISKAMERLCSQAQLEIALRTKETLTEYINATNKTNPRVYEELKKYSNGPRCTFPGYVCQNPCNFGTKSLERLI